MNDANFREYMRLLKRLKPRTRARPQWWLFQRWLRKRPLNHEFLVSPIHDYLYSCGIGDAAMMQIKWPAWVEEFSRRWWDVTPYPLAHLTVRDCLKALDTMRGWTPHIDWRRMERPRQWPATIALL